MIRRTSQPTRDLVIGLAVLAPAALLALAVLVVAGAVVAVGTRELVAWVWAWGA